ncbi:MAG: hypothetical protein L0312_25640 [Acidobacteria bacterium]|nr:hypothetical protein [Acidobacteriota bacterium]
MAHKGFYRQMGHHSATSQYGTLSRAFRMFNDEVRQQILAELTQQVFQNDRSQAEANVTPRVQQAHSLA